MIRRPSINFARNAIDRSVFRKLYKRKLVPETEVAPETKLRSLYYYRRLVLECTEKLDSPLDRQRVVDEIRWLFQQKQDETCPSEIAVLHAVCEEGRPG